jgi:hypothetical protein
MPSRRFPPPWTAELTPNCFIVRDADGQALSYVYYESEPGRRSAAKLLSEDEARRIAANVPLASCFTSPRSAKISSKQKINQTRHQECEKKPCGFTRSGPQRVFALRNCNVAFDFSPFTFSRDPVL